MDNGFTGNWLDVMPCSKLWGKGINLDMRDASSYTRIHILNQLPYVCVCEQKGHKGFLRKNIFSSISKKPYSAHVLLSVFSK